MILMSFETGNQMCVIDEVQPDDDTGEYHPPLNGYISAHIKSIFNDRKVDATKRDDVSPRIILDNEIDSNCMESFGKCYFMWPLMLFQVKNATNTKDTPFGMIQVSSKHI